VNRNHARPGVAALLGYPTALITPHRIPNSGRGLELADDERWLARARGQPPWRWLDPRANWRRLAQVRAPRVRIAQKPENVEAASHGRLILNEATDLPEGAEIELAVVHHHDDDAELLEELEASAADEAAGNLVDFDTVIARLGSKP